MTSYRLLSETNDVYGNPHNFNAIYYQLKFIKMLNYLIQIIARSAIPFLSRAFLSRAFLSRAFLSRAFLRRVINLSDEETQLLPLGLKFCPTSEEDSVAKTSSKFEPILKILDSGVESAATHDVASTLFNSKQRPSNLSIKQKMALKSLKKKSKDFKIVPADKGSATVVMTNSQYLQKIEDHLNSGTYSLLKKNPTESLSRKLDAVLNPLRITGTHMYHKFKCIFFISR